MIHFQCEACNQHIWKLNKSNLMSAEKLGRQFNHRHSVGVRYDLMRRGWLFMLTCDRHGICHDTTITDDHLAATGMHDINITIPKPRPRCDGCGIATSGVVPCPDCQPETQDMTIDNVTLLQIEQGVDMINCTYDIDGSEQRRNGKPGCYTFKLAPGSLMPKKGDLLLAARGNGGYALVEFISPAGDDFEPIGGVNYVWAIPLSTRTLDELQEIDRKARKTIRLGAAIAEAKQGLGAIAEKVTLLPGGAIGKQFSDENDKAE